MRAFARRWGSTTTTTSSSRASTPTAQAAAVVFIIRSSHNILRRVAGWDAGDGNTNIFGVHNGTHNLLEDCAGWGIARKTFSSSQNGNHTALRRCWGRWEGSHVVGPKMT